MNLMKEFHSSQFNYARVGNYHIFLDVYEENLELIEEINKKHNQRIHMFVTSADTRLVDNITHMISKFHSRDHKIVIHIPAQIADMKVVVDNIVENTDGWSWNVKVVKERQGPKFRIPGDGDSLHINYSNSGVSAYVTVIGKRYTGYNLGFRAFGGQAAAIINGAMKSYPNLFHKEIIDGFKTACPKGILKSFKSDEEIWEFVMKEGEWKDTPVSDINEHKFTLEEKKAIVDDAIKHDLLQSGHRVLMFPGERRKDDEFNGHN